MVALYTVGGRFITMMPILSDLWSAVHPNLRSY